MRQDRPRRNPGNVLVIKSNLKNNGPGGIAPQDVSRSLTITIASPDIPANNTASNTAIMTVSCFLHVMALVIIDPAGRISRGRGSGRAYAEDY